MTMEPILYPKKVALGAGIVGGITGGAVMYGMMSTLMTQIGMGANCFAIIMGLITGQSYENALYPGITAHFLTSIAIDWCTSEICDDGDFISTLFRNT